MIHTPVPHVVHVAGVGSFRLVTGGYAFTGSTVAVAPVTTFADMSVYTPRCRFVVFGWHYAAQLHVTQLVGPAPHVAPVAVACVQLPRSSRYSYWLFTVRLITRCRYVLEPVMTWTPRCSCPFALHCGQLDGRWVIAICYWPLPVDYDYPDCWTRCARNAVSERVTAGARPALP